MKLKNLGYYGIKAIQHHTLNKRKLLIISLREKDDGFKSFSKLKEPLVETIYGFEMYLNPEKYSGSYEIYRDRQYGEHKTTALFLELLKTNSDLVVDVGANLGWYSLLAAKKGARKVMSFEPDFQVNRFLQKSIDANRFGETIKLSKVCLMDYIGQCKFTESGSANVGVSSTVRNVDGAHSIRECTTLDFSFPSETIDILKLDVEGAEKRILSGASKLISDHRIKNLIMEYNQDAYESEDGFMKFASESGFNAKKVVDLESSPFNYHLSLEENLK